jgi:phosphoserine phosphatase
MPQTAPPMPLALSLISNPEQPALDDAYLVELQRALPAPTDMTWLSPGVAAEMIIQVSVGEAFEIGSLVRRKLGNRPVDVAVLPAEARRKGLLVADMDSTIIGQECIDELADYVGLKREVSVITERAMRGELEFEAALKQRTELLKGVPEAAIAEILSHHITVTPGARELVATMRANGATTALVSGGFSAFTGPISDWVGFDEHFANTLIIDNGRLTGQCEEPVRGQQAKLDALKSLRRRHELSDNDTLAVGDGANDLLMIQAAGLGVAYHAKPTVAESSDVRIDHGDLTALLYLQGYRDEDFVA